MTFGKGGTLFVGSRFPGNVYAIVDKGDHREVKTIAKGMYRSNGVAYKDGTLYVAELSRIIKYENIEANLDNPPAFKVVNDTLPKDEAHGWKFMTLGPDGWLYFQIGAPGNIVMPPYTNATINRVNPDTGVLQVVARGVRNSVGMDFDPVTHQLWFTNNGRDWVGDDLPNDTLHHVTRPNMNFGYPFCHQGDCWMTSSARTAPATSSTSPLTSWGPTSRRSACASTPASNSLPSTGTTSSSRSMARGTARRRSATTSRASCSTPRARS